MKIEQYSKPEISEVDIFLSWSTAYDIRKCQEWAFTYTNKLAQCLVHLYGQNSVAKIIYLFGNKNFIY